MQAEREKRGELKMKMTFPGCTEFAWVELRLGACPAQFPEEMRLDQGLEGHQ
jgi:hypothetical protein